MHQRKRDGKKENTPEKISQLERALRYFFPQRKHTLRCIKAVDLSIFFYESRVMRVAHNMSSSYFFPPTNGKGAERSDTNLLVYRVEIDRAADLIPVQKYMGYKSYVYFAVIRYLHSLLLVLKKSFSLSICVGVYLMTVELVWCW